MKKLISGSLFMFAVIFIAALMYSGCGDNAVENNNNNPGGNVNTTVSGVVLNENREPVSGATVKVNGNTATTGSGGEFIFNNISVPAGRVFAVVTANGYFNGAKAEEPVSGGVTTIKIIMLTKTVTHTINSSSGGSADLTNGSKVELQPNSVSVQGGSQYNGQINLSVVYMDPTSVSFSETVSGGDMAAVRTDNSSATLYSYGILKVIMEGSAGESLQLSSGSTSVITTTIPPSMVSDAPSTIPLWFFDEQTGLWREEGTATKQGDKYVGTVSHFTDWNCDYPFRTGSVTGRVVDCNNEPLPGITVKIGQVTTVTDQNGYFLRNVPAETGFNVSIEASQNFGISAPPVNVDPVSPGATTTIPDFHLSCYPVIKGIFTDCNGNVLSGNVSIKWDNQIHASVPNNSNGFKMTVAPNKTATLRFISSSGQVKDTTVQTPSTATVLDLGQIRMCGNVQQGENSFTINGAGFNNQFVNINPSVFIGIYNVPNNETATSSVNTNNEFLVLFFPGNTTGTFTQQNANIKYQGIDFFSTDNTTVTVNTYENVGGIISGTFNGSFESNQGTATINGSFFVIRQPDQN